MTTDDVRTREGPSADQETNRTTLARPADLLDHVGNRLGTSPWIVVPQADVDDFARVTGDEQWIHVDQERAAAGPFGTTIVHGFFVLALCARFIDLTMDLQDQGMSVNAGLDRVRFLSPVSVGARIRAHSDLAAAEAFDGGVKYWLTLTIELEGAEKPACVATVVAIAHDT